MEPLTPFEMTVCWLFIGLTVLTMACILGLAIHDLLVNFLVPA